MRSSLNINTTNTGSRKLRASRKDRSKSLQRLKETEAKYEKACEITEKVVKRLFQHGISCWMLEDEATIYKSFEDDEYVYSIRRSRKGAA